MLKIQSLVKSYGDLTVLKGIDFNISEGEVVAIIGPSGSGKSTFLKTINQLVTPDSGTMFFNGQKYDMASVSKKDATTLRRLTGMVFQNFGLFSHLNVLKNITLGLEKVHQMDGATAEKRGLELLSLVGLSDKANAYPNQLSGGQQQRVGIARAMASNPPLLLFDEPTSALDPELVGEVLSVIKKLAKAGMTMIIVTHEMAFAKDIADRIVFMDHGEVIMNDVPSLVFSEKARDRVRLFTKQ